MEDLLTRGQAFAEALNLIKEGGAVLLEVYLDGSFVTSFSFTGVDPSSLIPFLDLWVAKLALNLAFAGYSQDYRFKVGEKETQLTIPGLNI